MLNFIYLHFTLQTLILTLGTWLVTMLGAGMVLFFKSVNKIAIDLMLSISAGVMLASAFFSLLLPSIEQSETLFNNSYIVPITGFFVGGIFVVLADIFLEDIIKKQKTVKNLPKKRTFLMISAITLHNIPEGMCVGVAITSAFFGMEGSTLIGAVMLAVGIAIQNFPEGAAVSLPLRAEGYSRAKSFFWGQISGLVEPVFGVFASLIAFKILTLLPFLLSFSAGAMISVACTELIAESAKDNKNLTTLGILIGFCVMAFLDLAL